MYINILNYIVLEQFSVEHHKAKIKVINLANHNGHRQSNKPIDTQNKYLTDCQEVQENVCELITMVNFLYDVSLQGIMVVIFVMLDSIFHLMNTTTMIP